MKVSNAKEWAKKMALRIGEAVVISTIADKLAPTAKVFGGKVLDKFSQLQGRKGIEELDALAKQSSESEAVKPTETPAEKVATGIPTGTSPAVKVIVPPPPSSTTTDLHGPVQAKFE